MKVESFKNYNNGVKFSPEVYDFDFSNNKGVSSNPLLQDEIKSDKNLVNQN